MELKKIGLLSLAKIAGLFGVIYGLIAGILVAVSISLAGSDPTVLQALPTIAQTSGWKVIIFLPIIYGIIYFIAGIISALIYNLLARWVGGVKIELKESKK